MKHGQRKGFFIWPHIQLRFTCFTLVILSHAIFNFDSPLVRLIHPILINLLLIHWSICLTSSHHVILHSISYHDPYRVKMSHPPQKFVNSYLVPIPLVLQLCIFPYQIIFYSIEITNTTTAMFPPMNVVVGTPIFILIHTITLCCHVTIFRAPLSPEYFIVLDYLWDPLFYGIFVNQIKIQIEHGYFVIIL